MSQLELGNIFLLRMYLLHHLALKFLLGSVPMQLLPGFRERVFLHMRDWNAVYLWMSVLQDYIFINKRWASYSENRCAIHLSPSVDVAINIQDRQHIEIQVVQNLSHDSFLPIGANSLSIDQRDNKLGQTQMTQDSATLQYNRGR